MYNDDIREARCLLPPALPDCAKEPNQTNPIQSRRKSEKSAGNRQQQSPPLGRWAAVFFRRLRNLRHLRCFFCSFFSSSREWLLRSMKRAPVLAGRQGTEGRKAGALAHNTRESARGCPREEYSGPHYLSRPLPHARARCVAVVCRRNSGG